MNRLKKTSAAALTSALVIATTAGCGSDAAPSDWVAHEGKGFSISVPADFEESTKTSSNGEPMLVLDRDSGVTDAPVRVVVLRDYKPNAPADEQVKALEMVEHTEAEESDGRWVVEYDHEFYAPGVEVPTHFEQALWQVSDDLILNVLVIAPKAEFDDDLAEQIIDHFEITD